MVLSPHFIRFALPVHPSVCSARSAFERVVCVCVRWKLHSFGVTPIANPLVDYLPEPRTPLRASVRHRTACRHRRHREVGTQSSQIEIVEIKLFIETKRH